MSIVSENGILSDKDYNEFKERSIRTKFMWQVFAAVGSASFFGLFMEAAKIIIGTSTASIGFPAFAMAAVGAVCVYVAQRFYFESQTLDQDFQAKKIAMATDPLRAQALFQSVNAPTKGSPHATPITSGHEQHTQEASITKWVEKLGHHDHAEHRAHAHEHAPKERSIPKPHTDSWAEEVKADKAQQEERAHTIH